MLNQSLDRKALAGQFAMDGRIRIADVLKPEVAARIHEYCLSDAPFSFVYVMDSARRVSSAKEMAAMNNDEHRAMQRKLYEAASRGEGFLYRGYMMRRADKDTDNQKLKFLHEFFEYINGPDMLAFVSEVSGRDDLKSADAQYTLYTPGHYLTRHRDVVASHDRRVAYVFGFSQNWHPDWGGLLQFYRDDGTPRDAWTPTFNSLVLFDIRHVHAVTYVTPFALGPRLSLTGWFRSQPGEFSAST